jgi:hypothetical protein
MKPSHALIGGELIPIQFYELESPNQFGTYLVPFAKALLVEQTPCLNVYDIKGTKFLVLAGSAPETPFNVIVAEFNERGFDLGLEIPSVETRNILSMFTLLEVDDAFEVEFYEEEVILSSMGDIVMEDVRIAIECDSDPYFTDEPPF